MATVGVWIRGIAICYTKADNIRRVLFPFDECHSVEFKVWKRGMEAPRFIGHLGREKAIIEIIKEGVVSSPPESPAGTTTADFDKFVLNLTATAPLPAGAIHMPTHTKIKARTDLDKKSVLLRVQNAEFDVVADDMLPPPDMNMFLSDKKNKENVKKLAHSVVGAIELDLGENVAVNIGTTNLFRTPANQDWVLIFDNDCNEERKNQNDMDMFYTLIHDEDEPARQFRVFGTKKEDFKNSAAVTEERQSKKGSEERPDAKGRAAIIELIRLLITSIPMARLLDGKPCLAVQAKNADVLPD